MSDPNDNQRYSAFGDPMNNPLQRPPEVAMGEPTATRRRQRQDSVAGMGTSNWEDCPSDVPIDSMLQPQRRSTSHFDTIKPEGKGGQSSAGPQSRSQGRKHGRLNSMASLEEDLPLSAGSWSQTPERALNRKASKRLAKRKSVNLMSGSFRSGLKRQTSLSRRPATQYVKGPKSQAEKAQWELKRALSDINTNFELSDGQKATLEAQKGENERRWSELETQQTELIEKMSALKRKVPTTDTTEGGFLAIYSEAMKLLDSLTANVKDLFIRFEEASDLGARATFMEEHHTKATNKLLEASSKVIEDVFKQQNEGNEWEDEAIEDAALAKSSDEEEEEEEDDDDDDDDEQEENLNENGDQGEDEDKGKGRDEELGSKNVAFQDRFETSLSMKIRNELSQTLPQANAGLQTKSPNAEAFQRTGEAASAPSSAQSSQGPNRFLFGRRNPRDRPRLRRRGTTRTDSSMGRSDRPNPGTKKPSRSGKGAEHGPAKNDGPLPGDWSLQSAASSAGGPKSTESGAGSGPLESNAGHIQLTGSEGSSVALQAHQEPDEGEAASKDGVLSSPPLPQSGPSSASAWLSVSSAISGSDEPEEGKARKGKGKTRGVERGASKRGRVQEAIAFDKWLNDTVSYDFKDDSPIGGMNGEDSAGIRMEFGLAEEDSLDRFGVPRPASLHWSAPPSAGYSQGSPSPVSLRSACEKQARPGSARSPRSAATEKTAPPPTSSSEVVDPLPATSHEAEVAIQEETPQEPVAPRAIPLPVSPASELEPLEGEVPKPATPRAVPLPASVASESEAEEDLPRETIIPIVDPLPASSVESEAAIQDETTRGPLATSPSPISASLKPPQVVAQENAPLKPIIPPVNDDGGWEELSITPLIKSQVRPWWDLLRCLWIFIVVNPFCANAAIALELRAYLRWHLLGKESHWMPPLPSQPYLSPRSTLIILKHCFIALMIQVWIATTRERQIWLDANNMTRDYLISRVYDDPSISVLPGVDLNLMAGGRAVAAVLMGGMHLLDELILPKLGEFQVDLLTSAVPIFLFV